MSAHTGSMHKAGKASLPKNLKTVLAIELYENRNSPVSVLRATNGKDSQPCTSSAREDKASREFESVAS